MGLEVPEPNNVNPKRLEKCLFLNVVFLSLFSISTVTLNSLDVFLIVGTEAII